MGFFLHEKITQMGLKTIPLHSDGGRAGLGQSVFRFAFI